MATLIQILIISHPDYGNSLIGPSAPSLLPVSLAFIQLVMFQNFLCDRACVCAKLLQSCPTLCDPMDCSPPGSSVRGIVQVRILEWVAMPSSRGFFQPRDQTCISYISCLGRRVLYHLHHLGSCQKHSFPDWVFFFF